MSSPYLKAGYLYAIPALSVYFRRLAEATGIGPYNAIVDTGADMTIAPADILVDLQAQSMQETNLVSQWGDTHPVILYLVDLEIADQVFPGVLVAGDETADEIILGRNLLNLLPIFLDGPEQQSHVLDGATVHRFRGWR